MSELSPHPKKIAHYRIERWLGQGGMSMVYQGIDERLKRPVAIKVLHPFLAEKEEYRKRFFREARAVAKLSHPSIIQIFDVSSEDNGNDHFYIVTELLIGDTLADFANRMDLIRLPELSAMIVWQLALALAHAHQNDIIHRDIKPQNVMILSDGRIKLMDFGIAALGSDENLTQTGTLMGSLAHLSPEVIKGQQATVLSDIYSLTTVFYWMLCRRMPFISDSTHALLKAIAETPHKKIQLSSPFISDDLAEIVDIGMSKNPKNRFRSALAMAGAIEKAMADMGIGMDTKMMQATLSNPTAGLERFKVWIEEQVTAKIATYRQQGDERKALALSCRLGFAHGTDGAKPTRYSNAFGAFSIPALASALALLLSTIKGDGPLVRSGPEDISNAYGVDEKLDIAADIEETTSTLPEPLALEGMAAVADILEPAPKPTAQKIDSVDELSLGQIDILVWPFADIHLDSKLIAKDEKSLSLKLPKGLYRLTFSHDYAATVERMIRVEDPKKPMRIEISLTKSKPAFLVVRSDIDGDIAVDGKFKGTAENSINKPIVIPMPDRTHAEMREVMISREGYFPKVMTLEFIAGQTTKIDVSFLEVSGEEG